MKRLLLSLLVALALPTAVNSASSFLNNDPMTDRSSLIISEDSRDEVLNSIGVREKGKLLINCYDLKGKNLIIVAFQAPTFNSKDNQDLLVRFDKNKPYTIPGLVISAKKSFFLNTNENDEFINNMLNHSQVLIQWKDWPNKIRRVLSFDLPDLKEEMKKGKEKGCNFNF